MNIPTALIGSLTNRTKLVGTLQLRELEVEDMSSGWVIIADVAPQDSQDTVTSKVYQDAPGNTVIQSAIISSLDITLTVRSSYPVVSIDDTEYILTQAGDYGHYQGSINLTLTSGVSSIYDIEVMAVTPDEEDGPTDTVQVTLEEPPQVTSLSFTGSYPGSQTELKAGDTFQITGTTDANTDMIEVLDSGACDAAYEAVALGTSFTITGTIADRGTTVQALAASVRARDPDTLAYGDSRATNEDGGTTDGEDLVNVNNLYPSASFGTVSYPASQGALKGSEAATVPVTLSDYDSYVYDSPNAELSIDASAADSVDVSRAGGTYNVSTNNLRATVTRNANDAETIVQTVVNIAAVACQVTVTTPETRLRSGGNDGTSPQDHEITITANQELIEAPSISPDTDAGTFQGAAFTGGPTTWVRDLRVTDDNDKGAFTWQTPVATNLAGIVTNSIVSGDTYTLGGFVARDLTFAAAATTTTLNAEVVDFSKLQANLLTFSGNSAQKRPIGSSAPIVDSYTIDALDINPTTVTWLDSVAAAANTGTAQITDLEEIV